MALEPKAIYCHLVHHYPWAISVRKWDFSLYTSLWVWKKKETETDEIFRFKNTVDNCLLFLWSKQYTKWILIFLTPNNWFFSTKITRFENYLSSNANKLDSLLEPCLKLHHFDIWILDIFLFYLLICPGNTGFPITNLWNSVYLF